MVVSAASGSVYYLPVVWTKADYDPSYLGKQTIRGTVTVEAPVVSVGGVELNREGVTLEANDKDRRMRRKRGGCPAPP